MKAEGLVTAHEDKDQGYLLGDFEVFRQQVLGLPELPNMVNTESPESPAVPKAPKRKGRSHA